MERGKQRVSVEILTMAKSHFHMDGNWLLTGEGFPFTEENHCPSNDSSCLVECTPSHAGKGETTPKTGIWDNYTLIMQITPAWPEEATSKGKSMITEKNGTHAIRLDLLSRLGLSADDAKMIRMPGDNMVPTMADGDVVLVDSSIKHLVGPSIYAYVAGGALRISRLFPTLTGRVSIINDNPPIQQTGERST